MPDYSIIHAPSILGLKPSGVETLPQALEKTGFHAQLGISKTELLLPPLYSPIRDEATQICNSEGIRKYSLQLAHCVERLLSNGKFPIVLGGDCSILLGNMIALQRKGRYGLFFMDGHADFYQPSASPTGEAADMDLALVVGKGPSLLTDIEGRRPYVREEDVVLYGYRDQEDALASGSQDVRETKIHLYDETIVYQRGARRCAQEGLEKLSHTKGIWIHLDVDVLDDGIMPAVDYRMAGGLSFSQVSETLRTLMNSSQVIGLDVTIFNPALDKDGKIAKNLSECLLEGLKPK